MTVYVAEVCINTNISIILTSVDLRCHESLFINYLIMRRLIGFNVRVYWLKIFHKQVGRMEQIFVKECINGGMYKSCQSVSSSLTETNFDNLLMTDDREWCRRDVGCFTVVACE